MEQVPSQSSKGKAMGTPESVRTAKMRGDTDALKAMGRAGAKATNEKRARERVENEMFDMHRTEEFLDRQHEAGEDVVPLDS